MSAASSLPAKVKLHGSYRYSTAIVLCDQSWIDPDLDDTNGIQVREQRDMLRLESQILLVQLHIRKSLTVSAPCSASLFYSDRSTAGLMISTVVHSVQSMSLYVIL